MLNQIFIKGIFSDNYKTVKVDTINKHDDYTIFNNYRPLSVLPTFAKAFYIVFFNQVYERRHVNNLYFSIRSVHKKNTPLS